MKLDNTVAVIEAPAAHAALAQSRAGQIEAALADALGRPARVEVRAARAATRAAPALDRSEASQAMEHPLVKQAIEVFDARIVHVASEGAGGVAASDSGEPATEESA